MEYFSIIKDSDIFDNSLPEPEIYTDRPTAKGLVFDSESKVAFLWHPTEELDFSLAGELSKEKHQKKLLCVSVRKKLVAMCA